MRPAAPRRRFFAALAVVLATGLVVSLVAIGLLTRPAQAVVPVGTAGLLTVRVDRLLSTVAEPVTLSIEGRLPLPGSANYFILRSQVVPDLSPVSFLNYARLSTNSPPTTYNLYLFGGKPDQRFTLDHSTNIVGSPWTTGPLLEIFDGSGTLYYLETLSGTNIPPVEYYRAKLGL